MSDRLGPYYAGNSVLAAPAALLVCAAMVIASPPGHALPPAPGADRPGSASPATKGGEDGADRLVRIPSAVSAEEIEHNQRLDAAIAPALAVTLDTEDADRLRRAFKAVDTRAIDEARTLAAALSHPAARKLVEWDILRSGLGTIRESRAFLTDNPDWPNAWLITEHLEAALMTQASPAEIERHFATAKPETAMGEFALAKAHLSAGRLEEARVLTAATWRNGDIPGQHEEAVLASLGTLVSAADHKWRLDRLITDEKRWKAERNARAAVVRRQMARVSDGERKKAEARLAVFLRAKNAQALLDGLPQDARTDWSVVFHRIAFLRRSGKTTEAAKLLLSAPTDTNAIVNPDAWWEEREVNAYEALADDNPALAYRLVADAGQLSANPLKDQAFLAGWLALRHLRKPNDALRHFTVMDKAADGPLSSSKAAYWLGRTHEALGDATAATAAYQRAARVFDTFHGQLARQKLTPGAQDLPAGPPAAPSADQVDRFLANDAVVATVIAHKAGLGRSVTRPFVANLAARMPTEAEIALVAHLTRALGDAQQSLRIGKRAVAEGHNLIAYAYPLHAFPAYAPLRDPPEPAFLLAIARQESEFNTETVSGAGAKGILQVMSVTAKHVCRDYKITCEIDRLLTDEAYNTRIASAYIADRMGEFSGSYVLGLAGYNAGPGRTRQWIKAFGDPRSKAIDPIDWIERIPFSETRAYVGKVLSNIQIYRARLGDRQGPLRLASDLQRGR
ncbi:MAG: lytic transglycosylase domain-containing protein [Hyphomicrobiaceae bacterium]|nr:lytic transglycosylase domain-containing protein [Hyphomicrobiaceae bacterium]